MCRLAPKSQNQKALIAGESALIAMSTRMRIAKAGSWSIVRWRASMRTRWACGAAARDGDFDALVAVLVATVLLSVVIAWYRPPAAPGSNEYFTYSRAFLALFALTDLLFLYHVTEEYDPADD